MLITPQYLVLDHLAQHIVLRTTAWLQDHHPLHTFYGAEHLNKIEEHSWQVLLLEPNALPFGFDRTEYFHTLENYLEGIFDGEVFVVSVVEPKPEPVQEEVAGD